MRRSTFLLAVSLGLVTAAIPAPVSADHAQTEGGRTLAFDHVGGNEWWVEMVLGGASSSQVARVEAADTGGPWVPLDLKSWGEWAASFHIEPGHLVRFRASFADGTTITSCAFTHPAGVEQCSEPPPAGFDATFQPRNGNEWWIQVHVTANEPLAGVDARVNGGAWLALDLKSWGDWARSIHAPSGSVVEFRARSASGAIDVSEKYRWPEGTPIPTEPADQWPREGSYVVYHVEESEGSPGGAPRFGYELNVTLTYTGGRWEATCEGWDVEVSVESDEPTTHRTPVLLKASFAPPMGPAGARLGDEATHTQIDRCYLRGNQYGDLTVHTLGNTSQTRRGERVAAPTASAEYEEPDCHCLGSDASWSTRTGLLFSWSFGATGHGGHGFLKDTDAPIAWEDPAPRAPPAAAWPVEGSFVRYAAQTKSGEGDVFTNVTLRYVDGQWVGRCAGSGYDQPFSHAPFEGPLRVAAGDQVLIGAVWGCSATPGEDTLVKSRFTVRTTRLGQPVDTTAWYADETDADESAGHDHDAWWDADTGLLLRWEYKEGSLWTVGRLTDTDAPLG